MKNLLILVLLFVTSSRANAQFGNSNQNDQRNASWIAVPEVDENTAGLYLFRKKINLEFIPEEFEVHVSGDNRYKLYVNENLVSLGPAANDIDNWNYDTVDLARYLQEGVNILAAEVWNDGALRPISQFSYRTGFLLQGAVEETEVVNTDESWLSFKDNSYIPTRQNQNVRGYYAAVPGEKIDMNLKVKGWKKTNFNDSKWKKAHLISIESPNSMRMVDSDGWNLKPSIVPQMELTPERLVSVRRSEGISLPSEFPSEKSPVTIPVNSTAKILLDQTKLTNAYPTLIFSGGENSEIILTYAEALFDEEGVKGNRDIIEGKSIIGIQDKIISDGSNDQKFTALNWRTFRYLEIEVHTGDEPLVIEDIYGTFTGYPFELNAKIESDINEIDKIMEIGWRTARLCAVDTYMDTPYYERLQYIGDTRIQMMISYYNSGDDRLAKNAINLFDNSRKPDGYTLSRYPDTIDQVIPTYSLWHVSVLYDYLMYGKDKNFVNTKFLGTRQILNYFISNLDSDGSLKNIPGWNFTDWVPDWQSGVAPSDNDGNSALMDLQMLIALQSAVVLERMEGSPEFAELYGKLANELETIIQEKYWDESRNLYADTPKKDLFSQHANSLAILAGLVDDETALEIAETMLSDTTLTPASIYFKYYLHMALAEAGLGDNYLDWLDIWRKNIDLGLTTWAEISQVETARSDSHAWGSSPNIEFFRIILGIKSDAPYFEKVRIEPNLGTIEEISGEMPHPAGKIFVDYNKTVNGLVANINLPDGITGTFVWKGESYELKSGKNIIDEI